MEKECKASQDSYAVAFFDIDGTLLWRDKKEHATDGNDKGPHVLDLEAVAPTQAIYDAFAELAVRGHKTFICTGRPYHLISQRLHKLNPTGIVCEAGAYVEVNSTVVRDAAIPTDDVIKLAHIMWDAGINTDFEGNRENILLSKTEEMLLPNSMIAHSMEEFEKMAQNVRIAKFCVRNADPEKMEAISKQLQERFTVSNLQGGTFECSLNGINKASGIRAALEYLQHSEAHTFAFGDSENDLSMHEAVETFVAMGNALPSVKAVADYVTDPVQQDGVATGLRHFGLIS